MMIVVVGNIDAGAVTTLIEKRFGDWKQAVLLKGIALSTLLGVGSELTVSGDSDLVRAIRQSTQQNVAQGVAEPLPRLNRYSGAKTV
ncbi:hypothetical protein A7X12_11350 [Sphingomonas sp. TDK1]|nr:hypothetical protein A7X12_11350 [Sphingomonas sp. TDK1]